MNHTAAIGQTLTWIDVVTLFYLVTILALKVCMGETIFNEAATFGIHTTFFVLYFILLCVWGDRDVSSTCRVFVYFSFCFHRNYVFNEKLLFKRPSQTLKKVKHSKRHLKLLGYS